MCKCVNVLHTCTPPDEGSSVTCQVARAIRSFADKLFRSSEAEADNQPMWTCCRLFRPRGSQPSNLWFIRIQSRPRIREEALFLKRKITEIKCSIFSCFLDPKHRMDCHECNSPFCFLQHNIVTSTRGVFRLHVEGADLVHVRG